MGSSGSAPHFSSLVLFCLLQYSNCFSSYILCHHRNIAQTLSPGPWHEYCVNDITGLPLQHLSNSCGVFILMYSLNFVTAGAFDFTELDVPCIRRWWCLLLLENFPLRSDGERRATKRQMRHTAKNAQKASMTAELQLLDLPMEALEMILLEVVLQDGDAAYMNLSLTCSCFRAIVNKARFRQKAHYAWLDSVVNGEIGVKHQRLNCGCLLKLKSVTYVKPCSNPAPVFTVMGSVVT